MSRIMPVLTAAILPATELAAARLDGELFAVDEAWVCVDEPDRSDIRAAAMLALLPASASTGRLIMMGLTAAWLHGVTDPSPWRHEVCARSGERASLRLTPRFVLRELAMADADECRIGGLRVTTPVRTVFDLARRDSPGDAERLAIRSLMSAYGIGTADVAGIARGRLPGAHQVRERVEELQATIR